MKKLLLLLFVLFITQNAHAVTIPAYVTGDTVTFSTVTDVNRIITFSTATSHIKLFNQSTTKDCYVDLICRDTTGKTGGRSSWNTVLIVPAVGRASPSTVEIDFATFNIGFSTTTTGNSADLISYTVTGEQELR